MNKIWFVIGGIFILFTAVLPWFANFMTDLYWFEANGYDAVFWRRIVAQWELFAAALVPGFAVYALNWRVAWKRGSAFLGGAAETPQFRKIGKLVFAAAFVVAAVNALAAMGMWGEFLKFRNPVPFGETDPLFGLDIGFYVFTLPFVKFVQAWGQGVLMLALVGSCTVYFMTRAVSIQNGRPYAAPEARLHLTLLGALILVFWGAGYCSTAMSCFSRRPASSGARAIRTRASCFRRSLSSPLRCSRRRCCCASISSSRCGSFPRS